MNKVENEKNSSSEKKLLKQLIQSRFKARFT